MTNPTHKPLAQWTFLERLTADGPFRHLRHAAADAIAQVRHNGFRITEGVMRWTPSETVVPMEYAEAAEFMGYALDLARHRTACDAQTSAAIAAHRETQARMTPEQREERRMEARAAHGPGVELVDVLTGDRFTT